MELPQPHAAVLDRITASVAQDGRFVGLAAGGSLLTGDLDAYSDLDLVVVVADEHHASVMSHRVEVAATWGTLLAAFPGDHVGEPRLLICLYADPLLHVDLKFLTVDELARRSEDPVVVWESARALSRCLETTTAVPEVLDTQWIEDRFWTWIHYAATKLGRGELFEVLDLLGFLRGQVLAPLALHLSGTAARGVRRFEQRAPDLVPTLAGTVASHDQRECAAAILRCVTTYRSLRAGLADPPVRHPAAEEASVRYLEVVTRRFDERASVARSEPTP